jgi:Protein of unknown function with PCYCGC motif
MKHVFAVCAIFLAAALQAQMNGAGDLPAFHAKPPLPGEQLPAILTQKELVDQGYTKPAQTEGYKAAARAGRVMYQMPCYCHCDRGHGHTSLRMCFESTHGANCGICLAESLYTYKMSKKGWTAKMIRDGIVRGDYKTMDLQHPDPVQ